MACLILAFHRVAPEPEKDRWGLTVHPRELEECLRKLKRWALIGSLDDALGRLDDERLSVVITFDDGYRDFLEFAAPIIARLDIPVTLYLPTGYVESGKPFWWELVRALEWYPDARRTCARAWGWPESPAGAGKTVDEWLLRFKYMPPGPRDERLSIVEERVPALGALRAERLKELPESCAIANHTHSHTILALLKLGEVVDELEQSQRLIARWTGRESRHFAYPNGQTGNQDESHVQLLRKRGFVSAVTTGNGVNGERDHPMLLRRIVVSPGDGAGIMAYILSLFERLEFRLPSLSERIRLTLT